MSYTIQRKQLQNPLSASYAETASYVNPLSQDVIITGSILMDNVASIQGVDYIDFDTSYVIGTNAPAWKEGRLFYDSGSGALAFYNWEEEVTLNIGQEQWLRARNASGQVVPNGTPVRIEGAAGDKPNFELAQAVDQVGTFSNRNDIIGLTTQEIGIGETGFVTTFGIVNGLDTQDWVAGDILWVSQSAGELTNVAPQAPYDKIFVGVVTRRNPNNGSIFVRCEPPFHFHDISSVSASAYTYGDLWMYRETGSSGIWTNTKSLSGSYTVSGSMSFVKGGVTGSLFGTASWATNAITASVVSVSSTNTPNTYYLHFGNLTSGTDNIEVDTDLTYNPNTNVLTANTFAGDLTGNADSANSAGFANSAGNATLVDVSSFASVDEGVRHYFILENGVEGASSSETLYEHLLFSYNKQNNSYLIDSTENKLAPKITIGTQDSVDKVDFFIYGNVTATGIISAPNLSTGVNTLNFVGDYTRPEETISASFSVNNNVLTLTSASFATSLLTLSPIHPLPNAPATGTFAVSASSPPKPYFYNGTSWNPLY